MRLLDLFCGAGGAAMGYHRAGFDEIVGVDIKPQPHYPFEFIRADAIDVLDVLTMKHALPESGYRLEDFDVIHASPPCQGYSTAVTSADSPYVPTRGVNEPKLIAETRTLLEATGKSWVIENVMGAIAYMRNPIMLCGVSMGLSTPRHRLFESNVPMLAPGHAKCAGYAKHEAELRGWEYRDMTVTGKGRRAGTALRWKILLGVDWDCTQHELAEMIPPTYTQYIGGQLL